MRGTNLGKVNLINTGAETTSNTDGNIGKRSAVNSENFSRIFRVEVTDINVQDDFIRVGFTHKDHVNINSIDNIKSVDGVTRFYAILCDGIPIPSPGAFGLVVSVFGNKVGSDFFYLQTYYNPDKKDTPKPKQGSFSHITENAGIVINGNKAVSTISAGNNKVQVTDADVKIGQDGKGLQVSGRELLFKNSKGETRLSVGEDGVVISSLGDIKFISKEGNIEFVGAKVIQKKPSDLLQPKDEGLHGEDNSENYNKFVTGKVEFGASVYKISITDPSLITGNLFSGSAYSVEVMRGDSHFKLANGDFKISLLDGGITDKKFQVLVGKMSFLKKAELKLDSNGFTIASGTTTLKLSRYLLDFNDGGFGPLSYPKWQIGYRGAIRMKIGIMAEAPTFGESKMEMIADQIYLGRILVPGLDGGRVITTLTDPVVDYITGMMHIGSFSVFAIS